MPTMLVLETLKTHTTVYILSYLLYNDVVNKRF